MLRKTIVSALALGSIASGICHLPVLAQANYPLLAVGSTGESVGQLQATLKLLGFYQGAIDSTYSQSTLDAVTKFQAAAGITADGVAGPSTWRKLLPLPEDITTAAERPEPASAAESTASNPAASTVPSTVPLGPPVLRIEASGPAVSQLQRELQELGYYDGPIDGGFGEQTLAAVKKFQTEQQLFVDGVVGPSTWNALSNSLEKRTR